MIALIRVDESYTFANVERGLRGVVKDVDIIRKIFVGGIVVRALRAGQVSRLPPFSWKVSRDSRLG